MSGKDAVDMKNVPEEKINKPYYLDEDHNPFVVPNDEEIFLVRDREKEKQREARKEFNKKKVRNGWAW